MASCVLKIALFALFASSIDNAWSFEVGKFFSGFKIERPTPKPSVAKTKAELLQAVSFTNNGNDASLETQRQVLSLVRRLETIYPVSDNLLKDPREAEALNGVWYLQYTSSSDVGEDEKDVWKPDNSSEGASKIDTRAYKNKKGSIGAAGITVDTSNRLTTQIFDVEKKTVSNNVEQDFGTITVEGTFRPSDSVANRAIVAFEKCEITFKNGFVLNLGFLFSAVAALRGGIKDSGWLETTYLDADLRLGRGNKGSLFVLTRDRNAIQP